MAACRESIIGANGNIYDEILFEPSASPTVKHNSRYDTFPTRFKAATCPKGYTKPLPQEPHEIKENIKFGFSDIIVRTVNNVKQRVTRRISENGTDDESVSKSNMKQNLHRSRSTENICSDSAKSLTYPNIATGACVSHDGTIIQGRGHTFNRPLPRLPNISPLPVRGAKRDNQDYVNTALVRAAICPMPGGKSTKQTNDSGGIDTRDTVTEMDKAVNNKAAVFDKAPSYTGVRCNRGLRAQKISTEENEEDGRHPITSESQIVDEFEAAGGGIKSGIDVDKENAEETRTTVKVLRGTKDENHPEESDIRSMTITEIAERLNELNLANYIQLFKENQVDGMILANLKTDDLIQELGMKKLEAVRLKTFVESGHIPK